MIYVGIDVAKDTHYAAVANSGGEVLVEPFAFGNDAEGFCLFQTKLAAYDRDELLIGLESTGIYSENLICFHYGSGYYLAVINPIQTAALRKTNIRKTKTDKTDTLLIIKALMVNTYRLYSERDAESLKLKSLCRFRQNLKKSKARLKIHLSGFVNMLFSEFLNFFKSGIHIAASYTRCLRSIPHPKISPPYA
jgi:transposase